MNGKTENSAAKESLKPIEHHPLQPFLPPHASLLMLGSFPPSQKRWSMDFFYPNLQNDMWRIFGLHFFGNKQHFVDETSKCFKKEQIVEFLTQKGIALYDTATSVCRLQENASDKFLQIVEPTDVRRILHQLPLCRSIATTGQLATEQLCHTLNIPTPPPVGGNVTFTFDDGREIRLFRMPSSSRAYPLALEKKVGIYARMFDELFA